MASKKPPDLKEDIHNPFEEDQPPLQIQPVDPFEKKPPTHEAEFEEEDEVGTGDV